MNPEEKQKSKGGARLWKRKKPDKPKREKKPKPQRTPKQKVLRILYIVLTVIAALIVAGFVIANFLITPPNADSLATPKPQYTTVIDEDGNEIQVEIPGLAANRKEQFYTFLIVGQDTGGGGLTDTMMLAAYDVPNQTLNVMSLPRDTYVRYNGSKVLLNSVYNRAGAGESGIEALKEEVGELTGVTPDFYVIVQWEAVGDLVDAIGGVYFDVPLDMNYDDPTQDLHIHVSKGYQLLDGEAAMGVVRYRYGYADADLGRIKTQQAFLTAVIEKCLQPTVLLPNLMEYVTIFQKNVETDLSIANLAYFGKSAAGGLDMSQVEFVTMPNKSAGDAHLLPIGSEIVELINEGFNPYDEEITLKDLDLVTSITTSSSSSTSSSTATTSTPQPTQTPDETPAETQAETPAETPTESPSASAVPTATPSGGTSTGASQPSATAAPDSTTTATPTPTPVESSPSESPAAEVPSAEPTESTSASSSGSDYGPGMEPIE